MLKKISLILALVMCSALAWAQTPTGGVKGTVINRTNRSAVYNARLMLLSGSERVATATTDSDGNFLIPDLKDGALNSCPGFKDIFLFKLLGIGSKQQAVLAMHYP